MENMNPFTRLTVFFKNIVDNNIKMIKKIFAMIQQEHPLCQLILVWPSLNFSLSYYVVDLQGARLRWFIPELPA